MNPKIESGIDWAFKQPERIQQREWEVREFLKRVTEQLKPVRTLELGSWVGTHAALLALATNGTTISLDIQDYGGREEASKMACSSGHQLWFYLESARNPKTVEHVMNILGGPIDLLYIDDGHRIEEVTEEYQLWHPMVRKGGWIAFHDINPEANQCAPGVHPPICQAHVFWAGLKGNKEEIVWSEESGSPGIGILRT